MCVIRFPVYVMDMESEIQLQVLYKNTRNFPLLNQKFIWLAVSKMFKFGVKFVINKPIYVA